MISELEELGVIVQFHRKKAGLTQAQLFDSLGRQIDNDGFYGKWLEKDFKKYFEIEVIRTPYHQPWKNGRIERYFKSIKKNLRLYKNKGCDVCNHTGYLGRSGIFEIMLITPAIRELIMKRANADEIRAMSIQEGMTTMIEDGIKKVLNGTTKIEEVLRATRG